MSRLIWIAGSNSDGLYFKGNYYQAEHAPLFAVESIGLYTQLEDRGVGLNFDWVYSNSPRYESPINKIRVRDVEIASYDYAGTPPSPQGRWRTGIRCFAPYNIDISSVGIFNVRDFGILLSYPASCKHYLSHVSIQNAGSSGIEIRHGLEGFHLSNFEIVGCHYGINASPHLDENGNPTNGGGTVYNVSNGHIDTPFCAMAFARAGNIHVSNVSAWLTGMAQTNIVTFSDCYAVSVIGCTVTLVHHDNGPTCNAIALFSTSNVFVVGNQLDVNRYGVPLLYDSGTCKNVYVWPT